MNEDIPSKPLKMKPKLLEKISHSGTDIMCFKFSRTDEQNKDIYLNYKAGQYAIVDHGTTLPSQHAEYARTKRFSYRQTRIVLFQKFEVCKRELLSPIQMLFKKFFHDLF